MSADHRTRSTHLSRKKPIVLKKTILDAFWNWLDKQKTRKGSRFETAVKYAQNKKDTLMTYLLEHRPSEDMSDEQLEALTPWSKEVQNVCKN